MMHRSISVKLQGEETRQQLGISTWPKSFVQYCPTAQHLWMVKKVTSSLKHL